MSQSTDELKKLSGELKKEARRMAVDVREGGRAGREGFEKAFKAVHRMHRFLFTLAHKMDRLRENLNLEE